MAAESWSCTGAAALEHLPLANKGKGLVGSRKLTIGEVRCLLAGRIGVDVEAVAYTAVGEWRSWGAEIGKEGAWHPGAQDEVEGEEVVGIDLDTAVWAAGDHIHCVGRARSVGQVHSDLEISRVYNRCCLSVDSRLRIPGLDDTDRRVCDHHTGHAAENIELKASVSAKFLPKLQITESISKRT